MSINKITDALRFFSLKFYLLYYQYSFSAYNTYFPIFHSYDRPRVSIFNLSFSISNFFQQEPLPLIDGIYAWPWSVCLPSLIYLASILIPVDMPILLFDFLAVCCLCIILR